MNLKRSLIYFFLFTPFYTIAQNDSYNVLKSDSSVFQVVEVIPAFPGGDSGLMKYLAKNVKYPKEAKQNSIHGKVIVTFVISKEGKVQNPVIVKGLGYGCDEEALRVMNNMPDWKPGTQNGRDVAVQFSLPILFDKGDPYHFAR